MANLKVELVHDEAGFFRFTRVGNWVHSLDYQTGEEEWEWNLEEKHGEPENLPEAPAGRDLRRPDVPSLPSL